MEHIEKVGLRRGISHLFFYTNKAMFSSGPLILMTIFCVSGVLQPTIVEYLTLNGAFDKSTLLIVLPNYLGMSFAVWTRYEVVHTLPYVVWWNMVVLSFVDILSQGLCLIGLVFAGSSIYIIVYSSTTIWAAVWSYFLLQKQLNIQQWIGIVVVVLGLGVTALDSKAGGTSAKAVDAIVGIVLILFGSFTHALTWVLIEKWTTRQDSGCPVVDKAVRPYSSHDAPASSAPPCQEAAPELVCSLMGIFGSVVYSTWQLLYTVPRWDALVVAPIAAKGGSVWHIGVAFCLLAFMGFLHAVSFYHLLGHVGSVATGVLKGVQSVAVLMLSHEAFCSVEVSQCFTLYKGVSLVVVLSGVYFYSAYTGGTGVEVRGRHKYSAIGDCDSANDVVHRSQELL